MKKPKGHPRKKSHPKLYRYDWDSGEVSFVLASSPGEAAFLLDEFGAAETEDVRELEGSDSFLLTLKPTREDDDEADEDDSSDERFVYDWVLSELGDLSADELDAKSHYAQRERFLMIPESPDPSGGPEQPTQ